MERKELIDNITEFLSSLKKPHPVRVAIDGADAAGKSILANELAESLIHVGRNVIRASIDGFHKPKKERYKRGTDSAEGYYYYSFDYNSLRKALLIPLGPGGNLQYNPAVFDYRTDSPIQESMQLAQKDSILLFDGVFLLRPELIEHWDYRIFVKVSFETVLQRVLSRDQHLFGSTEEVRNRYLRRYIPGQKFYLKESKPETNANIVIDNNDPSNPLIVSP